MTCSLQNNILLKIQNGSTHALSYKFQTTIPVLFPNQLISFVPRFLFSKTEFVKAYITFSRHFVLIW